MKKVDNREICVDILILIVEIKKFRDISLHQELQEHYNLSKQDKNFIYNLVSETIDNLILVDYIIKDFTDIEMLKSEPFLLNLLRVSIYELLLKWNAGNDLEKHYINIAKKRCDKKQNKFYKEVLKFILENNSTIIFPKESEQVNYLSVNFSYPLWIIKYWFNVYGFDTVLEILKQNKVKPKVSVALNTRTLSKGIILKALENEEVLFQRDEKNRNIITFDHIKKISKLESFQNGLFYEINKI